MSKEDLEILWFMGVPWIISVAGMVIFGSLSNYLYWKIYKSQLEEFIEYLFEGLAGMCSLYFFIGGIFVVPMGLMAILDWIF